MSFHAPREKRFARTALVLSISAICTSNVRRVLLKALSAQKHPMHGEQIGSPSAAHLRNRRISRPRRKRAFHFTPTHPRAVRLKKPRAGHRRSSSAPRPRRKRAFHFTPMHPRAARLKKPRAGHQRSSCVRKKIGVSERTSRVRLSASTSSVQRAKSARAIRVSRSKPIPHSHISR